VPLLATAACDSTISTTEKHTSSFFGIGGSSKSRASKHLSTASASAGAGGSTSKKVSVLVDRPLSIMGGPLIEPTEDDDLPAWMALAKMAVSLVPLFTHFYSVLEA
jgi:hypothetical protein